MPSGLSRIRRVDQAHAKRALPDKASRSKPMPSGLTVDATTIGVDWCISEHGIWMPVKYLRGAHYGIVLVSTPRALVQWSVVSHGGHSGRQAAAANRISRQIRRRL
jgi:hypothetical protein